MKTNLVDLGFGKTCDENIKQFNLNTVREFQRSSFVKNNSKKIVKNNFVDSGFGETCDGNIIEGEQKKVR